MAKPKTEEAKLQSKIDNTRDAMNASNGFKNLPSAGTQGVGDGLKNKR